ncbi:hypothetical protein LLEC1_03701 [Akanthomyces lecanii]|uniref:Uncharacterized protein n=1 Tax=Cordyceps confragosa TaxID=2714763 RepID=A0A179IU51_CORDF|nr:hypothetical protein LLEC1_03701 [Akanthomyces lecanii]
MISSLVSLLALAPATLVYGVEFHGVWNVQRLRQDCSQAGCNQEFYINGERLIDADPFVNRRTFDAFCGGLGLGGQWKECRSLNPYTPAGGGGFAKMSDWNETSNTAEVWFTWLSPNGAKTVNETGRMVVEPYVVWDVASCRQMIIVSRENV